MQSALRAWLSIALIVVGTISFAAAPDGELAAAERAVKYLAVEVPKWQRENRCYSCHNNGDACRALMQAGSAGLKVDRESLADTLSFLNEPAKWDANGPDGPFKDVKLARIQFAAALADAWQMKLVEDRKALPQAAALVAELQQEDGSWPSDAPGTLGSPVTYGEALATAMALKTLRVAGRAEDQPRIAKAIAWYETREPKNVLEASATLIALATETSANAVRRREQSIELIKSGQSDDGAWGPFVTSPPEVFDTALVVIALSQQADRESLTPLINRARAYLITRQQPDGSWPPTTRPPGADSYAQQLSTTAWALQALLP